MDMSAARGRSQACTIKGGKSGGMMSFRRGGKKKDTDTHGDEDDGDLSRSVSAFGRAASMMQGSKVPKNMKFTVERKLGNRIGIQLNARNRVAVVDKGTPVRPRGAASPCGVRRVGPSCAGPPHPRTALARAPHPPRAGALGDREVIAPIEAVFP